MNKQLAAVFMATLVLSQPVLAAERNPEDPYEPYNRVMFKVNDTADQYVIIPLARGYRAVTPPPVRMGVSNFFYNLRDVISFGSNLLRLDLEKASTDLVRVGINTTFGLGGLIQAAGQIKVLLAGVGYFQHFGGHEKGVGMAKKSVFRRIQANNHIAEAVAHG